MPREIFGVVKIHAVVFRVVILLNLKMDPIFSSETMGSSYQTSQTTHKIGSKYS